MNLDLAHDRPMPGLPTPVIDDHLPVDPNLTYSLYADGCLDDLLPHLLLPLRQRLRQADIKAFVWTVRYARRGRHLKLRLHVDEPSRSLVDRWLREMVQGYLVSIADQPEPNERSQLENIPVIDPEDADEGLAEDRRLVETRYQRSYVNLGGAPFLDHDPYALAMARALSQGLDGVLAGFEGGDPLPSLWQADDSWRQKTLLKALLSGMPAALAVPGDDLAAYAEFHRDCLLRFYVSDPDEDIATRGLFGRQLERSPIQALRALARKSHQPSAATDGSADPTDGWQSSLRDLRLYLDTFEGDPEYRTHPLAEKVSWPPIFKVFHGVANQIGMAPIREAFVHHLMAEVFTNLDDLSSGDDR